MRALARLSLALVLSLGAACASHGKGAAGAKPAKHDEITYDQIQALHVNNAYDAVQALHSNWLATRGTDSFQTPSQVWVYLDDTRLGGVDSLREIAPNTVGYIQHYDGISATARWGLNHGAGVIYVSSRRR